MPQILTVSDSVHRAASWVPCHRGGVCRWELDVVTGGGESPSRLAWVKSVIAATLVAVLVVSAFVGVVSLGSRPAAAAGPRSLRIGTVAWQVTTFNPMAITLVDEYIIIYSVYSTLLTHDASYHLQGDLAYAWSLAPDNVTWTFHLVRNAYFIDPTNPTDRSHSVTAADVVFTYNMQIAQSGSILHTYTSDIQSVTAVDSYTVQIVTDRPVATMDSTAVNIPIMPQYVWSTIKNPVKNNPKYPIGSGGYYYDTVNSGSTLAILLKNPAYYWNTYYCTVMKPDEIRYINYDNPGTMVTAFTTGANNLNALIGIDPTTYNGQALGNWTPKWAVNQGFVGEISSNLMTNAQRAAYVAAGNQSFKTGSNSQILATNLTIRRAIAMSIDKNTLISDALGGLATPGDTLVPDTNPWHYTIPSQYQYHFDPTAARALLNAAGWAWDANGNPAGASTYPLYQKGKTNGTVYWPLIFRFYTLNTEDWWKKAAGDIVQWLNDAGIETVDVHRNEGFGAYSINQMSGYWLSADYDMWLWDWVFTPASDPSSDIMEVETSMAIGPTSDNFYNNPTYDALYNQSVTTTNPVARRNILDQLQLMVYNETSYIIPFYKSDLYAALVGPTPSGGQGWQNWGDWNVQNGLTPDSDLMNLWAHVDPTDDPAPVITSFPELVWFNGTEATISVSVNDPQAAVLNYSFDFGDGSPIYNTTTVPVTHTYANVGNYTIKVRVTNSEWPACASTTAQIVPPGSINLPPQILGFAPNVLSAYKDQPVWFNLSAKDYEGDPLYVTWNFGDGSATAVNYTVPQPNVKVTFSQKHAYTAIGSYKTTVVVTDNKTAPNLNHSPDANVTVDVITPPSKPQAAPVQTNWFIDYGIPILVVAAIVAAAAVILWRRRKKAQKEEAEVEEEPKQSPPAPPPPP